MHPNTATAIRAVWFAVHDVNAQLRTLRDAGFNGDMSRDVQLLGTDGRELKAGAGTMVLLGPSTKSGLVKKYLSNHDEGIIGLSIEVTNLGKARRFAEEASGKKIKIYKGAYGQSFLLSPNLTHGVSVEMFQP